MSDAVRTLADVSDVLRTADLLIEVLGPEDVAVRGASQDSRTVAPGELFLAWEGTDADAHDFVGSAARAGAVAAVVERPVETDLPQLVVRDGRRAAALAAHALFGFPSHRLFAAGVTGTNGKTTTALVARHLLGAFARPAAIGTLGIVDDEGVRPGTEGLTTPGPVQLAEWLRDLVDDGIGAVVMEASSHALEQARLDAVRFDVAVFTNLTQDHLDYHGDMAAYRAAKVRLVELVAPRGTIVVNAADPAWEGLDVGERSVVRYAIDAPADLRAVDVRLGRSGTDFVLHAEGDTWAVRTPFVGRYNVENALAAIGVARAAGVSMDRIVDGLADAPLVPGRLQTLVSEPFAVLLDFAHTPDALRGALTALKSLTSGRLIVLFGAGGDRDPTKRRPMGEAVKALADVIVVTSDNPRTEDPEAIIDDVVEGLHGVDFVREADRRAAIRIALETARPGDTVLLAGKGSEHYQIIGTEKLPFDEPGIALSTLEELGVR